MMTSDNEKLIEAARRLPDQFQAVQLSETQYHEDQALAELDAVGYVAVHTASRLADALEAAETDAMIDSDLANGVLASHWGPQGEPSEAQAEVERRYPGNEHLTYVPLYVQMKREAFIEGAEWARTAGGA